MLTQGHLKSIKPQAKMRRYHDGHGLYLQVMPQGGRYWRMKYHIKVADKRKEKTIVAIATAGLSVTVLDTHCLLYTSPSPRDREKSRMPSSA